MQVHRYRVSFRTLRNRVVEYAVKATDAHRAEAAARALARAERRNIKGLIEVRQTKR